MTHHSLQDQSKKAKEDVVLTKERIDQYFQSRWY